MSYIYSIIYNHLYKYNEKYNVIIFVQDEITLRFEVSCRIDFHMFFNFSHLY